MDESSEPFCFVTFSIAPYELSGGDVGKCPWPRFISLFTTINVVLRGDGSTCIYIVSVIVIVRAPDTISLADRKWMIVPDVMSMARAERILLLGVVYIDTGFYGCSFDSECQHSVGRRFRIMASWKPISMLIRPTICIYHTTDGKFVWEENVCTTIKGVWRWLYLSSFFVRV